MERIEMNEFFSSLVREGLLQQAEKVFPLYETKEIVATLYELGASGTMLEVYWKQRDNREFIALDRREANDIDTFIWAFADFEWLVIDDFQRKLLQKRLDHFNQAALAV